MLFSFHYGRGWEAATWPQQPYGGLALSGEDAVTHPILLLPQLLSDCGFGPRLRAGSYSGNATALRITANSHAAYGCEPIVGMFHGWPRTDTCWKLQNSREGSGVRVRRIRKQPLGVNS